MKFHVLKETYFLIFSRSIVNLNKQSFNVRHDNFKRNFLRQMVTKEYLVKILRIVCKLARIFLTQLF